MSIWAATVTRAGLPHLGWDGDTTYAGVRAFADRLGLDVDWSSTEIGRVNGEFTAPLLLDPQIDAIAVMARINALCERS